MSSYTVNKATLTCSRSIFPLSCIGNISNWLIFKSLLKAVILSTESAGDEVVGKHVHVSHLRLSADLGVCVGGLKIHLYTVTIC